MKTKFHITDKSGRHQAWYTDKAKVTSHPHDYDLMRFLVYEYPTGVFLGSIYPEDLDSQNQIINDLNQGKCPIRDKWELE